MLMPIQLIILEFFNKNLKIFKHCANIDAVNKLNTGLYSVAPATGVVLPYLGATV